jgi:hypothetical protein
MILRSRACAAGRSARALRTSTVRSLTCPPPLAQAPIRQGFEVADTAFTALYTIELGLSLFIHWCALPAALHAALQLLSARAARVRFWPFVTNGWCIFDAVVVVGSRPSSCSLPASLQPPYHIRRRGVCDRGSLEPPAP